MHLRMSPACIDSDIDLVTIGISIMLPQEVEYSKLLDALGLRPWYQCLHIVMCIASRQLAGNDYSIQLNLHPCSQPSQAD